MTRSGNFWNRNGSPKQANSFTNEPLLDISKTTSIHIRSTDKYLEAKIMEPRHYFKVMKYTCLVHKHLCMSKHTWVATDNDKNRDAFNSVMKSDSSMKNFTTFGIRGGKLVGKYSSESFLAILTDLEVLSKSR